MAAKTLKRKNGGKDLQEEFSYSKVSKNMNR
jgi:hypothetical protein